MNLKTFITITTAAAIGTAGIAAPAFATAAAKPQAMQVAALTKTSAKATTRAPKHRISKSRAKAIALRAVPGGHVTEYNFEKEGSGWRHSFDIRQGKQVREIGVDANNGKIVENTIEKGKDKD